jgi:hypothetical protein
LALLATLTGAILLLLLTRLLARLTTLLLLRADCAAAGRDSGWGFDSDSLYFLPTLVVRAPRPNVKTTRGSLIRFPVMQMVTP